MSPDPTLLRQARPAAEVRTERRAVTVVLPWAIAAAAVVLYVGMLNPWQSMTSSQVLGWASGWSLQPDLSRPLYWLVTLPLRLLPDASIPLALGVFTAVCAGLTLALLARSVALLPHDRTEQQRARERSPNSLLTIATAWLPPLAAAVACGLQLSFWEQATAVSPEIFDLLLFAYVIRCILEYRRAADDSWLLRAGFVYAAAMTGNWAMLGFAPLFLVALIWSKGLSFFEARFLGRLLFLGSVGLCLYLLLPAVTSLSGNMPFWQALKINLGYQKNYLISFIFNKGLLLSGDHPLWVLALPSLVPLLAISVRWPSYFGDRSRAGLLLATWTFNFLFAVFLGFCAWVLLDPQFSPRNYMPALNAYMSFLPLYYLTALTLGYFCGYFLLVFGGAKPVHRFPRPEPGYVSLLNGVVTVAVFAVTALLPVMLVYSNGKTVGSSGPLFLKYAEQKTAGLPKGAILLADNPLDLVLVHHLLLRQGARGDFLLLDTQLMPKTAYHRFLSKKQPQLWPAQVTPSGNELSGLDLSSMLVKAAKAHPVYYLHPSFGYYFESFSSTPDGLRLKMEPLGTNQFLNPPLTDAEIASNQASWKEAYPVLDQLAQASQPQKQSSHAGFLARVADKLTLLRTPNRELQSLALSYSRALDNWAVQLQRHGKLAEAETCFARALELTPDSFSAELNLACNRNLQAGRPPGVSLASGSSLLEKAQHRGNIQNVLNLDGPVDEPSACTDAANAFFEGHNYRQAAHEFQRVSEFRPTDLWSRCLLAQTMVMSGRPSDALAVVDQIHARQAELGVNQTNAPQLLETELAAHLLNRDEAGAEKVVETALSRYGADERLLAIASHVYLSTGYSSNALNMLERELKVRPDDAGALVNLGVAWLRLTNYANALPPLTRVIQMGTNGTADLYYRALFNRALAYGRSEQLDLAQADLQKMQQTFPQAPGVLLSLGEIAYRRKDTNVALRSYEQFLQNAPTNTPEAVGVLGRVKELKRGKR